MAMALGYQSPLPYVSAMDDEALIANSGRFSPSWYLVPGTDDDSLSQALGRHVVDGCPEPLPTESGARWFAVTAIVGVAADDDGYPTSGDESLVTRVGRGTGVVLATDRTIVGVLREGDFLNDAGGALVFSFDLSDVVGVEGDTRRMPLRKRTRSLTVELDGASWGAVGLAVTGEVQRTEGQRGAPITPCDADALLAMLPQPPTDPAAD
jgi:hypothetical protein